MTVGANVIIGTEVSKNVSIVDCTSMGLVEQRNKGLVRLLSIIVAFAIKWVILKACAEKIKQVRM